MLQSAQFTRKKEIPRNP